MSVRAATDVAVYSSSMGRLGVRLDSRRSRHCLLWNSPYEMSDHISPNNVETYERRVTLPPVPCDGSLLDFNGTAARSLQGISPVLTRAGPELLTSV